MKEIDLLNWNRREIFYMYNNAFESAFYSISCNIDITNIFKFAKKNNLSIFKTLLYVIVRSVNSVQKLNYRINGNKVF